jgi:hypothetical protein
MRGSLVAFSSRLTPLVRFFSLVPAMVVVVDVEVVQERLAPGLHKILV